MTTVSLTRNPMPRRFVLGLVIGAVVAMIDRMAAIWR
jgi:hypothetical protein